MQEEKTEARAYVAGKLQMCTVRIINGKKVIESADCRCCGETFHHYQLPYPELLCKTCNDKEYDWKKCIGGVWYYHNDFWESIVDLWRPIPKKMSWSKIKQKNDKDFLWAETLWDEQYRRRP